MMIMYDLLYRSMCFHLISPMSAGLFRGVIAESGGCDVINMVTRTLENAEAQGQLFASYTNSSIANGNGNGNCAITSVQNNYTAQVQCMRSASPSALLQAWINGGQYQHHCHRSIN
jgi:hypothetical protein